MVQQGPRNTPKSYVDSWGSVNGPAVFAAKTGIFNKENPKLVELNADSWGRASVILERNKQQHRDRVGLWDPKNADKIKAGQRKTLATGRKQVIKKKKLHPGQLNFWHQWMEEELAAAIVKYGWGKWEYLYKKVSFELVGPSKGNEPRRPFNALKDKAHSPGMKKRVQDLQEAMKKQ